MYLTVKSKKGVPYREEQKRCTLPLRARKVYLTVKSKTGVPYREDREEVYLTVNSKKGVPYREERFFGGGGEELRQFPNFLTPRSLLFWSILF